MFQIAIIPPVARLMMGEIKSATIELITAVNAAAMMIPTARSITLPREIKVLNAGL